jgi:Sulfatase-modifying factor enzyme 1
LCQDGYDAGYYATSPQTAPPGPSGASSRAARGGAWRGAPTFCRPARRGWNAPGLRSSFLGFRLAAAGGAGGLSTSATPGPGQSLADKPPVPPVAPPPGSPAASPLKPAEKTPLPPTRLVHVDEFNGPRSGLPRDPDVPHDPGHGQSDGVFFVYSPGGFHAWDIHGVGTDCTCEVVGRVLSNDPRRAGCWSVLILRTVAPYRGFRVKINIKGELFLDPNPWPGGKEFSQIDPRFGPIIHPSIKQGCEYNKLLLVVRKREVLILVNGVQVCGPVKFDYDLTPAKLEFSAVGPGKKRAEFDRLEIREFIDPGQDKPKAK